MTIDHIKLLMGRCYKKPVRKVCPKDRRFLLHQFFWCFQDETVWRSQGGSSRRCGDSRGWWFREFSSEKQDWSGCSGFRVSRVRREAQGFAMPEVFGWCVDNVGLSDGDYLFLRFGNAGGSKNIAQGKHSVGYSTVAVQLKGFCLKNDIAVLTLYSWCRGGVTLLVECGVGKMTIK